MRRCEFRDAVRDIVTPLGFTEYVDHKSFIKVINQRAIWVDIFSGNVVKVTVVYPTGRIRTRFTSNDSVPVPRMLEALGRAVSKVVMDAALS